MFKKLNIKIFLGLLILIILVFYLFSNLVIGSDKYTYLKSLLSNEHKQLIKKYIFPYKMISQQQQIISQQQQIISQLKNNPVMSFTDLEVTFKENNSEISTIESYINLSNKKVLKKHKLLSGFYSGINLRYPGSGYIDFHQNNIIVLSSRGILVFKKNIEDTDKNFKKIKNNIGDFIGAKQFKKSYKMSIKDLLIKENRIFVSYIEEIKPDCFNTVLIYADMNYDNIKFKKLFSPNECVNRFKSIFDDFNFHQSGGRIVSLNDNHILLSTGEYRNRHLAQDIKSINGKIIKINIDNGKFDIISMGHRNPQGLYFDKENKFLLETEHGPKGGDEINLIEIDKINKEKIQNYGWPISSAGEHYGGKTEKNIKRYKKYPLYKSHNEHGFIEPLHSFVPSIGISEIVKIGQNKYSVSSMRDQSLYFFEINEKKQMTNLNRVEVFERVRDLKFNNNHLFLFMEETASIGVINLE